MKRFAAVMTRVLVPSFVLLGCSGDTLPGQPPGGGAGQSSGGQQSGGRSTGSTGGAASQGGRGGTNAGATQGGGPDCSLIECFRAVECVEQCGGPVLASGCCPCAEGTFDSIECSTPGGNGGSSAGGATSPGRGGRDAGGTSTDGGADAGGEGGSGGSTSVGGAKGSGGSTSVGGTGGSGGSSLGPVTLSQAISDPKTKGSGSCSGLTLADVIARIHEARPELADIDILYAPSGSVVGDGSVIYAFRTAQGFRFVFVRGSGDCLAGCIDHEYWYFESDSSCEPREVGHYARIYGSGGNCFEIQGMPLWGFPALRLDGACPGADLSELNSPCVDDACSTGLTPVHFFGIAGPAGPEFCWCTIPCEKSPRLCPDGTQCVSIADGPGLVCSQ